MKYTFFSTARNFWREQNVREGKFSRNLCGFKEFMEKKNLFTAENFVL